MKKQSANTKKKTANDTGDVWELYPVESNHNIVRLPVSCEDDFCDVKSVTFDKSKSIYSIDELKTSGSGLISGTSTLTLDGNTYDINLTYRELCKILFA